MTVKVAGLWELGWSAPVTEYEVWVHMLRDFGVEGWYMAPVSGIARPKVTEVESLEAAVAAENGLVPVVLSEDGSIPLRDFVHPQEALYVVGKANRALPVVAGAPRVRIETPQHSLGLLWPHQALAIALYDREVKS